MNGIRKLFLVISMFMFILTLLIVNLVWTVNNTITEREVVTGWIDDSGFYDNIVNEVVKMTESKIEDSQNQNQNENSEPQIDTALMARAAEKVFTPDVIKEKLETVLNGTYDWLEGVTPNLQFTLDLTDEKAAFAESLGDEARARMIGLPDCSQAQIASLADVDALSVQCKPPDYETIVANFKQEFATSDEFLKETTINGADLKSENNGVEQPITETLSSAPSVYQFSKQLIWVMLLAAILWGIFVVFLSKNKRFGIKHIAVAFLVSGILVAITATITSQVSKVIKAEDSTQEIAVSLVRESTKTISSIEFMVAGVYALIFVALMLFLYLTKSKSKEVPEKAPVEHPHTESGVETDKTKLEESTSETEKSVDESQKLIKK